MNESPVRGSEPLRLDEDVAAWLHELAERDYEGDVGYAMNAALRGMMLVMTDPDPWAGLSYQARAKAMRSQYPLSSAELAQDDR